MPLTIDDAIKLQKKLAGKVIKHDVINYDKIRYICGVDVSYRDDRAFTCAVVIDKHNFDLIDSISSIIKIQTPYIPSLFFLRESEPIFSVLKGLRYDVLMVDGHGILHPRQFGLACYIGMKVNKPTIGVAKSILCGNVRKNGSILLNGKIAGYAVKTDAKPVYVSIGYKISLRTAVKLVREVTKCRIPEPLRLADINSRKMAKHNV